MAEPEFDLVLAGGGLANGLIAWRLHQRRPELRICIIEREPRLGGHHTWSFHETDVSPAQLRWLEPLLSCRWTQHEVRFPAYRRTLPGGYCSIGSERFASVLEATLPAGTIMAGTTIRSLDPTSVTLADGRRIVAQAVIDGRGALDSMHFALGFQRFLGQEWQLAEPHGLAGPVLMDATVPQLDGYRFVYTLPFAPDRVLVEDTYYTQDAGFDPAVLRLRIADYLRAQGWRPVHCLREERGVLPIVLSGEPEQAWSAADGMPRSGLAAVLLHPTTGYSLPEAVRLADLIAGLPDLSAAALFAAIRAHALSRWRRHGFLRMLNRMLFLAAEPAQRYRVLERFYRLSPGLIARFYAGELQALDKLRLVSGRPPVPLGPALRAIARHDCHVHQGAT